jgi:hypothetical protein
MNTLLGLGAVAGATLAATAVLSRTDSSVPSLSAPHFNLVLGCPHFRPLISYLLGVSRGFGAIGVTYSGIATRKAA